jgi:hypothetical protein
MRRTLVVRSVIGIFRHLSASVDVFKDFASGDARDRRCVTQPTPSLLYCPYWRTIRYSPYPVNEPYCRLRTCAHAVSDPINM